MALSFLNRWHLSLYPDHGSIIHMFENFKPHSTFGTIGYFNVSFFINMKPTLDQFLLNILVFIQVLYVMYSLNSLYTCSLNYIVTYLCQT